MASGRLFQVRGPAMANRNDLSPNEVCVRGTWSFPLSADLIPGRRSTLRWQNSARYSGARPLIHLCQICTLPFTISWSFSCNVIPWKQKWLLAYQNQHGLVLSDGVTTDGGSNTLKTVAKKPQTDIKMSLISSIHIYFCEERGHRQPDTSHTTATNLSPNSFQLKGRVIVQGRVLSLYVQCTVLRKGVTKHGHYQL